MADDIDNSEVESDCVIELLMEKGFTNGEVITAVAKVIFEAGAADMGRVNAAVEVIRNYRGKNDMIQVCSALIAVLYGEQDEDNS